MSGNTPTERKYTKIKNFTEKDQVRIKYSLLGKEKKLMLSVYIGEDVYNQLTDGREYKRLNTTYIPGDMVVISPTNDDKGLIHRYNGRGMFKTTCVRISLGKMKGLKLSKRDFINRVVEYSVLYGGIDEPSNALRIDISNSKKIKFTLTNTDIIEKDNVTKQKEVELKDIRKLCGEPEKLTLDHLFLAKQKIEGEPIPYIPFNDLDEIQEKIDKLLKKHEDLAEAVVSIYELLNNELVRIKGKDEFESPDNRRIAMLEARFSRLELALEDKNKSLFEKLFGK